MRRSVGSTIVVMALAAACSGGGDDPAAPTDPTPPTSAAPTSTEAAEPTSTTSTTSNATTAPPATSPPDSSTPTSDIPVESVEDEIRAAYEVRFDSYWACLRAPLQCDTSYLVDGGPSYLGLQNTMQALADRDRYVGDDDVGYFVIEEIDIDPSGVSATVTACWWSTAVLYGPPVDPDRPVGPDNPATIVNDLPGSARLRDEFAHTNSRWRLSSAATEELGSEDECGGN